MGEARPPAGPAKPPVSRRLQDVVSLQDVVYRRLSEDLLAGRVAPGEPLSLRGLAARLGVSPMPVRDAVRRLVAEEALIINPLNRRLSVAELSAARLDQLTLARGWVEPELAARAAHRTSPGLVERLRRIDAAVDAAILAGDPAGYMAANHAFHFAIYEAAEADLLVRMARGLWMQTGPHMRSVFESLGEGAMSADHHMALIAAIAEADSAGARTAMQADLLMGMSAIARTLGLPLA